MYIKLERVNKNFGSNPVLQDISFRVQGNELLSFIGPSGVGKTTLLKIIAGLDKADSGQIYFEPKPSKKQPVILVFQDYVLFPNMTVYENIAFGLRSRKIKKGQIAAKVRSMLEYFHLEDKQEQYPAQLSAGQSQRVALARAMIINPAVLLLDEPFANLDRNLKMETADFIRRTQREFGIPTISVTHDLEEAFAMSDKIGIVLAGQLQQFDTPLNVYFRPANYQVARFLGPVNSIPASHYALLGINADKAAYEQLYVRPEALEIVSDPKGKGRVQEVHFAGHYIIYQVWLGKRYFTVYSLKQGYQPGDVVNLSLAGDHLVASGIGK
jgi:putative spermidine/putrescine transport system ATP-binding protein